MTENDCIDITTDLICESVYNEKINKCKLYQRCKSAGGLPISQQFKAFELQKYESLLEYKLVGKYVPLVLLSSAILYNMENSPRSAFSYKIAVAATSMPHTPALVDITHKEYSELFKTELVNMINLFGFEATTPKNYIKLIPKEFGTMVRPVNLSLYSSGSCRRFLNFNVSNGLHLQFMFDCSEDFFLYER